MPGAKDEAAAGFRTRRREAKGMALDDPDAQLSLLLAGFRKGMGYGALAGFFIYPAVLLGMSPAAAGPILGVAAGMMTAILGGAVVGGLVGAYIKLLRRRKE